MRTGQFRFDVALLAERLVGATEWATLHPELRALRIGLFGSSTGAAAALVAAAELPNVIGAVVSRGGRIDLAGPALCHVYAPTLLVVGDADQPILELTRESMRHLRAEHELAVIPGAGHLFEEPGALEAVARLATGWFVRLLASAERGLQP